MTLPDRRQKINSRCSKKQALCRGCFFLCCTVGGRPVWQDYSAIVILFWQLSVKYGFF